MQTGVRRTLRIAVTALFLLLVLAACGSGSDSGGVASVDGTSGNETTGNATAGNADKDPEKAALEFARCMREHGVDMPDPGPNGEIRITAGPGDDEGKLQEAQNACEHIMEDARPQLSEEQQSVMQDAMLAFAKCMREHGIDMPDPEFGEGGKVMQRARRGQGGFGPDDPRFEEAQKACQPIMDEAAREAGLPTGDGPSRRRSGDGS